MKGWLWLIESTPRNIFQRKIRPKPLNEVYGLESLLPLGIGDGESD